MSTKWELAKLYTLALGSMLAGASLVHRLMRPNMAIPVDSHDDAPPPAAPALLQPQPSKTPPA